VRILVAEDNEDQIELMRVAFRKAGVSVKLDFVQDGDQVLQYLQAHSPFTARKNEALPDVLLLDLKMPRYDGFEVLSWLREHPPYDRIPVVVFSGSDQPVDINRALGLGAARYLVKPQKLTDMVQMVTGIYRFCLKTQGEQAHV